MPAAGPNRPGALAGCVSRLTSPKGRKGCAVKKFMQRAGALAADACTVALGVAALALVGLPFAAFAGLSLWLSPVIGLLILVLASRW